VRPPARATTGSAIAAFILSVIVSVMASVAAPHSARAALCATTIATEAHLSEVDAQVRLDWIDGRLAKARRSASLWSWSWGLGIGASGVASLAVVPFVNHAERVDWYTSAVSAAAGVIPIVLAPPAVMRDARELHARILPEGGAETGTKTGTKMRTKEDVCALLADAEARLQRDAEDQRRQQAWWFHAGNLAFNTGIALFLGLGYHHWSSGVINGAAGLVVGEALILTQPTRTIDDLRAYRAGDLAPRGEGPPALSLTWGYGARF